MQEIMEVIKKIINILIIPFFVWICLPKMLFFFLKGYGIHPFNAHKDTGFLQWNISFWNMSARARS